MSEAEDLATAFEGIIETNILARLDRSSPGLLLSNRKEMVRMIVERLGAMSGRLEAEISLSISVFTPMTDENSGPESDLEGPNQFVAAFHALKTRHSELAGLLKNIQKEVESDEQARDEGIINRLNELSSQYKSSLEYCCIISKQATRFMDSSIGKFADFAAVCARTADQCLNATETAIGEALSTHFELLHDSLVQTFDLLKSDAQMTDGNIDIFVTAYIQSPR